MKQLDLESSAHENFYMENIYPYCCEKDITDAKLRLIANRYLAAYDAHIVFDDYDVEECIQFDNDDKYVKFVSKYR
jgi:hypothetical protein